jgi:hypothetical protein
LTKQAVPWPSGSAKACGYTVFTPHRPDAAQQELQVAFGLGGIGVVDVVEIHVHLLGGAGVVAHVAAATTEGACRRCSTGKAPVQTLR